MWIKAGLAIISAIGLGACDTPSLAFRGVPAQIVTVEPSVFAVRRLGTQVELLRTNTEYAPTFASIIPRASQAVFIATGCTPRPQSWAGEQTLMQVEIDCPDI
ncbi:hypothetical protein OAN307_c05530 [Octadecabacter antarcticus 307]|uniref:Lipoprotein n=1 Tax=Octadecabacter antarcticus 307 TaxID=391626 RepID=M9R7J0_9RHOB|nr:hypothetical protein [Octadecabacter antarcticus]AGI66291.1 hypothetical protein OAN307_c05530 [Octadecabacter antarcticus 307]